MADGSVKIDVIADDSKFTKTIDGLNDEAKKAADGVEELGDAGKKAGSGLDALDVAAGTFIAQGLTALVSGVFDAVSSFAALADSTREYREDMARLETAFTVQGHSAETASKAYEDMYAILGESDRSVEAANHLAELTKNEKELSKWSTIVAGVSAKFGDSLPIEGLTEAANETAKVGAVTGPLADALNWAGVSEDEFNKKLEKCNSEQERATLITETLNGLYEEAATEYNKLTETTQAQNRANAELESSQAALGEAMAPLTTAWTNFRASALEAILPVIQTVSNGIMALSGWLSEHQMAADILKGVIIALTAAFVIFGGAIGGALIIGKLGELKAGFTALTSSMTFLTNPTFLIIAGIAALAAGIIYLYKNCEWFRDIINEIGKFIKEKFIATVEWLGEAWTAVADAVSEKWQELKDDFSDIWESITEAASDSWSAVKDFFSDAWDFIKNIWNNSAIGAYFRAIWATISGIFSVVKSVLSGNFSAAWEAIKGIFSAWGAYFQSVWNNIKSIFAPVVSWFSSTFGSAKNAVTNVWNSIKGYFTDIYGKIKGAFKNMKADFTKIGSNIIDGIWAGLKAGWDWLKGKVGGLAESLYTKAKNVLGIKSPSRKFKYIGEMSGEGIGVGFDEELPNIEKKIKGSLTGLTARVQTTVGAASSKVGQTMGTPETGITDLTRAVGVQTAGINSLSAEYRRGVNNTKTVVLELNGRELGRTMVDVSGAEDARVGTKLSYGGAWA